MASLLVPRGGSLFLVYASTILLTDASLPFCFFALDDFDAFPRVLFLRACEYPSCTKRDHFSENVASADNFCKDDRHSLNTTDAS